MSEERYIACLDTVACEKYIHDTQQNKPLATTQVCKLLHTQSARIAELERENAELREDLRFLKDDFSEDDIAILKWGSGHEDEEISNKAKRFLRILGVEVPDAAKGG